MPTIVRLGNCVIRIFFDDHNPPHFHIQGSDFAALVEIESLRIIEMRGRRNALKEALDWASSNKNILWEAWERYSK